MPEGIGEIKPPEPLRPADTLLKFLENKTQGSNSGILDRRTIKPDRPFVEHLIGDETDHVVAHIKSEEKLDHGKVTIGYIDPEVPGKENPFRHIKASGNSTHVQLDGYVKMINSDGSMIYYPVIRDETQSLQVLKTEVDTSKLAPSRGNADNPLDEVFQKIGTDEFKASIMTPSDIQALLSDIEPLFP